MRAPRTFDWTRLALVLCAGTLPAASLAGFDENLTFDAGTLVLANLAGELRVVGHDGPAFELEIRVRGEDASRDRVHIESREGERTEVFIAYPVDRDVRIIYPEMGRRSSTEFNLRRRGDRDRSLLESSLADQGARRVRVSGRGRGEKVWADIVVRVPNGKHLRAEVGAGYAEIEGVNASVSLDVWTGPVSATHVNGDLSIDTGSGHVEVAAVRGELSIDTGSGHVSVNDCEGRRVSLDTGSGHVEVDRIVCQRLDIDTGSGHVSATDISADRAHIDTGSGRVELALARMVDGDYSVDTGSGSITLLLPAAASAEVSAETGSGRIRVDVDDMHVYHRAKDEVSFRIGNGDARVDLDTGSGSVRISSR